MKAGVVVVAATSNDAEAFNPGGDTGSVPIAWPACLDNVISVAALHNGAIETYSNTTGKLDFWAEGRVTGYDNSKQRGTSFAAPVVAAAYSILREANPSATIAQMTSALRSTGKSIPDPRNGSRGYRINAASIQAAAKSIEVPPPPPPPTTVTIGQTDKGSYGNGFGSNQHPRGYTLKVNVPRQSRQPINTKPGLASISTAVSARASNIGSYKLTYQAFDIDYLGEVSLYINGKFVRNLDTTGNNFVKNGFADKLGDDFIRVGDNSIEFRVNTSNAIWGVRNIKLSYITPPDIPLTLGVVNKTSYGREYGTDQHYAGIKFKFKNPDSHAQFSVTGWDIDVTDETAVYLNNASIGYLTRGASSQLNSGDLIRINKNQFISGTNTIELRQKKPNSAWNGFQDEKWGVRDILISKRSSSIAPIIYLLLSDD